MSKFRAHQVFELKQPHEILALKISETPPQEEGKSLCFSSLSRPLRFGLTNSACGALGCSRGHAILPAPGRPQRHSSYSISQAT